MVSRVSGSQPTEVDSADAPKPGVTVAATSTAVNTADFSAQTRIVGVGSPARARCRRRLKPSAANPTTATAVNAQPSHSGMFLFMIASTWLSR